jgi:heme A synthase
VRRKPYDKSVRDKLARVAWLVLGYNVLVILWGAYVRATGSGAGCGAHWPLCNGEVIPRAPSTEMLVEFSHRATSGLALVAVVVLVGWVFRACRAGHPARLGAALAMVFMLAEAGVGAGLVLFRLVADNASLARAMFMAVHLTNTFLLLAALALTAHWLSGGARVALGARPGRTLAAALVLVGVLVVGISGAIAALGDTLFPAASIRDALVADASATSHLLVRLRVLHPALAIAAAAGLVAAVGRFPLKPDDHRGRTAARAVVLLAIVQVGVGFLNVLLLAPVWMQLVHLLLADALWIALVLLAASTLAIEEPAAMRRVA